ncbi:MAG: hypothetical protein U9R15_10585 [Chloroflexota bacterium]|nr:hypothetical protein [Chloroflexota bacterium]
MNGEHIINQAFNQVDVGIDDMRPEYDFTGTAGGVRGKYHRAYQIGHTVKIHQADDTTVVQHFKPEEGAVLLGQMCANTFLIQKP